MTDTRSAAPSTSTRREFLQQVETGVVAGMCRGLLARGATTGAALSLLGACAGARFVRATVDGQRLVVQRPDITPHGVLVDSPQDSLPIYLRAAGADAFTAVSTACTHRGCQAEPTNDRLACPCHGSEFAFDGKVLRGPAESPLTRHQVTVEGDRVIIHLVSRAPQGMW